MLPLLCVVSVVVHVGSACRGLDGGEKLVERTRGWTARRKILVYLIAQLILLGLVIMIVRAWNADVPTLSYLGPWLGAVVGGLIGICIGSKRASA
ncbi:hypothetical protein ACWD4Z_38570 [Streptomyces antibioticus]